VQRNDDGTFHVVVVAGNAEHMFADRFASEDAAEWACSLFNAAIGVRLIPRTSAHHHRPPLIARE
jgi:hypothetical protein